MTKQQIVVTLLLTVCKVLRLIQGETAITYTSAAADVGQKEAEGRLTWTSPKMQELQKDWDALRRSLGPTAKKATYEQNANKLNGLITGRISRDEMQQLIASCTSLPVAPADRTDFSNAVLRAMVDVFVSAGDRDSLVSLFSLRFVQEMSLHLHTEHFLVLRGEKLRDPILVLSEAYIASRVPETRSQVAGAVRRAFSDLGIAGKDDDEFVRNAAIWYERNRQKVMLNPLYDLNLLRAAQEHPTALFIPRTASDPRP